MLRTKDIDPKGEIDIANPKIKSRLGDRAVISTANLIPSRREVTREDVDKFVERVKESKKEKN
jgi:hypothetical protein